MMVITIIAVRPLRNWIKNKVLIADPLSINQAEKQEKWWQAAFFIIILIAALFRLIGLAHVPPGLYADEASTGYDAYSLLLTARDQYGHFLPLLARSLNDYNEALFRYALVPFIAVLGLSEFTIRLLPAIIGTLTVGVLLFLVKKMFNSKIAFWSTLFLAISPWHIQFSRIAFRAILFPFLFCIGLYFLIKSIDTKRFAWYLASVVVFFITLWTYMAARVFVPLFFIGAILITLKEVRFAKRSIIYLLGVFLVAYLASLSIWLSPEGMARANATLALAPLRNIYYYSTYFSPDFLFFSGDSLWRCSPRGMGQLYIFELITILTGLGVLFYYRNSLQSKLLGLWLVLYPIPAALTQSNNALRSIVGAPLFAILSGIGISTLISFFKGARKIIVTTVTFTIILISAGFYVKNYFFDYPIYAAKDWQYGMRQAITFVQQPRFKHVKVSDSLGYPYIFILFYTKFPPHLYQQSVINGDRNHIGKYRTGPLKALLPLKPGEILVANKEDYNFLKKLSIKFDIIKEIPYPDQTASIFILSSGGE